MHLETSVKSTHILAISKSPLKPAFFQSSVFRTLFDIMYFASAQQSKTRLNQTNICSVVAVQVVLQSCINNDYNLFPHIGTHT